MNTDNMQNTEQKEGEVKFGAASYRIGISWEDIPAPFDIGEIEAGGFVGSGWFIKIPGYAYYLDEKFNWHEIKSPNLAMYRFFFVNGAIFASHSNLSNYVSIDCQKWTKLKRIEHPLAGVVKFHDKYTIIATEEIAFAYKKVNSFFNPTATLSYDHIFGWSSVDPLCGYEEVKSFRFLKEGYWAYSNVASNGELVILGCGTSVHYKKYYKLQSVEKFVLYNKGEGWEYAEWPEYMSEHTNGSFYFLNGRGIYLFKGKYVLVSENGIKWTAADIEYYSPESGGICNNLFISRPGSSGNSLISMDGINFNMITVSDPGHWEHLFYSEKNLLGVYKFKKKALLKYGTLNIAEN